MHLEKCCNASEQQPREADKACLKWQLRAGLDLHNMLSRKRRHRQRWKRIVEWSTFIIEQAK